MTGDWEAVFRPARRVRSKLWYPGGLRVVSRRAARGMPAGCATVDVRAQGQLGPRAAARLPEWPGSQGSWDPGRLPVTQDAVSHSTLVDGGRLRAACKRPGLRAACKQPGCTPAVSNLGCTPPVNRGCAPPVSNRAARRL